MERWAMVSSVLVAGLVGATIPALLQLRATLRDLEKMMVRAGGRLEEVLDGSPVAGPGPGPAAETHPAPRRGDSAKAPTAPRPIEGVDYKHVHPRAEKPAA